MLKLAAIVLLAAMVAPTRAESGAAGQDCWTRTELHEAAELAGELIADGDFDRALGWSRRVAERGHSGGRLFLDCCS